MEQDDTDFDMTNFENDFTDDIDNISPVEFDKKQAYVDMIAAHRQGDAEKANNIFSDILSNKTTEMLSGWYHMAGNLKTHLTSPSKT